MPDPARPGPERLRGGRGARDGGRGALPIAALSYRPRGTKWSGAAGAPSLSLLAAGQRGGAGRGAALEEEAPGCGEGRRAPCPEAAERRRRAAVPAGEPGAPLTFAKARRARHWRPLAQAARGWVSKKERLTHPQLRRCKVRMGTNLLVKLRLCKA